MIDLHSLYTPKQTECWLHKKWKEMKNKQTAVEWLTKEFVKLESTIGVHGIMYELMEQAKEMEKKQIIDAASWIPNDCNQFEYKPNLGNKYYNKKFDK